MKRPASDVTDTSCNWNTHLPTAAAVPGSGVRRLPVTAGSNRSVFLLVGFRVAVLLALFTTQCCLARAQSIVGSIGGSVTDSTGAAVPDASVSVINKATDETRTFSTDSAGSFTISALIPGDRKSVV